VLLSAPGATEQSVEDHGDAPLGYITEKPQNSIVILQHEILILYEISWMMPSTLRETFRTKQCQNQTTTFLP